MMDKESRKAIEEMERQFGKPTGIGRIMRGECPKGATNPMACMFCMEGHQLECHYPRTCEEAECGHWKEQMAEEEWEERGEVHNDVVQEEDTEEAVSDYQGGSETGRGAGID